MAWNFSSNIFSQNSMPSAVESIICKTTGVHKSLFQRNYKKWLHASKQYLFYPVYILTKNN